MPISQCAPDIKKWVGWNNVANVVELAKPSSKFCIIDEILLECLI